VPADRHRAPGTGALAPHARDVRAQLALGAPQLDPVQPNSATHGNSDMGHRSAHGDKETV
jgi:hypothetical protein